jgi:hypothetical protein
MQASSQNKSPTVLVKNMECVKAATNHYDLNKLLQDGYYSNGLVEPTNMHFPADYGVPGTNSHAYLHFTMTEDAVRVQEYLHGMIMKGTTLVATLILPNAPPPLGYQQKNPTVLVKNMGCNDKYSNHCDLNKCLANGYDTHGLVAPINIHFPDDYGASVRNSHAYLHFTMTEDADRAQKYLHGMKLNNSIISAALIVQEGTTVPPPPIGEKDVTLLASVMFPTLSGKDGMSDSKTSCALEGCWARRSNSMA